MLLKGRITRADYTHYKNRLTMVIHKVKAIYYAQLFLETLGTVREC